MNNLHEQTKQITLTGFEIRELVGALIQEENFCRKLLGAARNTHNQKYVIGEITHLRNLRNKFLT